jgi:hypothetical protein
MTAARSVVGRGGRFAGAAFGPAAVQLREFLQSADFCARNPDGAANTHMTDIAVSHLQAQPFTRTPDLFSSLGQRDQFLISHSGRFYAPQSKCSTYRVVAGQLIRWYN